MNTKRRQFKLRTLFFATSVFAVLISIFAYNMFAAYLTSIALIAGMTTCISRIHLGQTQVFAGIQGVFTGSAFGALLGGLCVSITTDPVTGFFAFWVGSAIGFLISLAPVFLIAIAHTLYPRPKANPIPQPDLSIPRIEPYTDTQGY